MNQEYASYLESDAWQFKRLQRLAMSNFRCAACTENKSVHVHHLTYERIFTEEMSDLLPLCEDHHKIAEALVKEGKLFRRGDVLFLATETVRLILESQQRRAIVPLRHPRIPRIILETRNDTQKMLVENPLFSRLVEMGCSRKKMKRIVKQQISSKNKVINNACILYDRFAKQQARDILKQSASVPAFMVHHC